MPSRLASIDILRGLTMALMILVNDPGDWHHVYTQLDHAEWSGFTLTDFVFPNFLFLVGVSLILSLESRIARGDTRRHLALHIVRRSAIIFALDLLLTLIPHFHYHHLRLFGVLTRIALCYLLAGLLCLFTRRARNLAIVAAALLLTYWALVRFVPVPGFGIPTHQIPLLDPDRNLTAYLDRAFTAFTQRWLQTGSLYEHTRDPEGLLSTLPAVATVLTGSLAAIWLRRTSSLLHRITPTRCRNGLLLAGASSAGAGLLWNLSFPINKKLWTSSYVLFAAGLSLLCLAAVYDLIEIRRLNQTPVGRVFSFPWLVFGTNAITAYAVSGLIVKLAELIHLPGSGHSMPLLAWIYQHLFAFNGSTDNTSLLYALAYTLLCFLPILVLYRRRIFLKI